MAVSSKIKENIKKLSQLSGRDVKDILQIFKKYYTSDFVQNDPSFKTNEDKLDYAYRVTHVNVLSRGKSDLVDIIPVGYEDSRLTKKGKLMSSIYALYDDDGDLKRVKIVMSGDNLANQYKNIELFKKYHVKLGTGKNVFFGNEDTEFRDPEDISSNPIDMMINDWDAKNVTIIDTVKNPSREDKNGYIDRMDLRIIRGVVSQKPRIIDRNDGSQTGVYNIGDTSTDLVDDDQISDDGVIIPSTFTVWCPVGMVQYDKDSIVDCIGYVRHSSKGEDTTGTEPQMNAICVLPVHVIPLTDDDEIEEVDK